ncbi:MAG: hypothetical protein AAF716_04425 [Cyanobacteria bacterium P01_D01_bin.1]
MAKSSSSGSGRKSRDSADQRRDRTVYRYLLTLTDTGMSLDSDTGEKQLPNETHIAKQWGGEANRVFVRRVLRSVLDDEFYPDQDSKQTSVPGLTLAKLVSILSALQAYRVKHRSINDANKASRIITRDEKLTALSLFFQLSAQERTALDLEPHPGEALLKLIFDRASDPQGPYKYRDVARLYQFFQKQLNAGSPENFSADGLDSVNLNNEIEPLPLTQQIGVLPLPNPALALATSPETKLQQFIEETVSHYTVQHSKGLSEDEKKRRDDSFVIRVSREIERIELQCGSEQADRFLPIEGIGKTHRLYNRLTKDFVRQLVYSVVDNELLTDEFPVHIKHFTIERAKPLPLQIKQGEGSDGLLNPFFLDDGKKYHSGLEGQVAYRVRVDFCIKRLDDFEPIFKDITTFKSGQLDFFEEVVGVSSPISHINAVINRVLFWDIPLLSDYVSIADGTQCNDVVMNGAPNSPVWSHSVARLHKREDVKNAIASNQECNERVTASETASADFCGFDLLETTAKASLFARLRLIKQTLAHDPLHSAKDYIKQLCDRIEEVTALKKAHDYLSFYPFSLRAMEGQIESTIFRDGRYRKRLPNLTFKHEPNRPWNSVALEAQLSVAEANLKEGLVRIARKHLNAMAGYFEGDRKEHIGDLLMTRYHLCLFRYYYLSDADELSRLSMDRYRAIRRAEEELNKAEGYLHERTRCYDKLNELPLSNLHPQMYFLSRIYAHRAKLHIFFPSYMMTGGLGLQEKLQEPIRLLEKARIYAARDGDPALYAQWSAYQAWCYIMLAYINQSEKVSRQNEFSFESCLDWAERLIAHAKICFSAKGKTCYQQIKNAGGKKTQYPYEVKVPVEPESGEDEVFEPPRKPTVYFDQYGDTFVQVAPLIQELFQEDQRKEKQSQSLHRIVTLDLSLLKKLGKDEGGSIFLFGMQSGIILFSDAMFSLCGTHSKSSDLIKAIDEKAIRLFQYSCAITSDGTRRIEEDDEYWPKWATKGKQKILARQVFESEEDDNHAKDRLLQYLYPHRLTQFADFSKIFIIVCRLILLVANTDASEDFVDVEVGRVRALLKELRENNQFPFAEHHAQGQKKYNGHLEDHYFRFETYVDKFINAFEKQKLRSLDIIYLRDQMVADVFSILRGETSIVPRMY